jgi:hypothetical protein
MQIFIGALIGALIQILGTLVGKILVSLGIGYAVYSGVDLSITYARDFFLAKVAAQGANAVAVASSLKVGVCVSIITSAITTRLTINGLTGGTLKRFTVK